MGRKVTERDPSLPGLYELVTLERTDSARAHAERLAADGAAEGTLVWAKAQQEGLGRRGNHWMSGSKNLHCAIVLRPDQELTECCQLSLMGCICTAMAIARQAEPLEELRFRWPNDVLLNRGKVAGITLSGELRPGEQVPWLVVGVNVNAYEHPASKGFDAASMRGEGFPQHDRVALLEAYAREFLSWINRWAEEGLAPIRKQWLNRSDEGREQVTIHLGDTTLTGHVTGLDDRGSLQLRAADGVRHTLSLREFFLPDFQAAEQHPG